MKTSRRENSADPEGRQKRGGQPWQRKVAAEKAERAAEAAEVRALQETAASRSLCENIAEASSGCCFLGFSRGKDSIAAWLYLRRFFNRIIPFHCASVPRLSFVDESLDYYEQCFETPILRFMDGACTGAINRLVWQPPGAESVIDGMELWEFDKHDIHAALRREMNLPDAWCAFGINMSDSIDRRIYVQKNQGRNQERMTFYPCFDWTKDMIMQEIKAAGIKLPKDYLMMARTMAAIPSYRHLLRMEAMFPGDFRRVELMFPMVRAELARQAFREMKAAGIPKAKAGHGKVREHTAGKNESPSTGGQK